MYLFCRLTIMYKTILSVVRSFHGKKNPDCRKFQQNFLLHKKNPPRNLGRTILDRNHPVSPLKQVRKDNVPTYAIPITGNNRGNLLDAVLHFVSGFRLKKWILMKRSASLLGDDLQNRPDAAFHRHSSL